MRHNFSCSLFWVFKFSNYILFLLLLPFLVFQGAVAVSSVLCIGWCQSQGNSTLFRDLFDGLFGSGNINRQGRRGRHGWSRCKCTLWGWLCGRPKLIYLAVVFASGFARFQTSFSIQSGWWSNTVAIIGKRRRRQGGGRGGRGGRTNTAVCTNQWTTSATQ